MLIKPLFILMSFFSFFTVLASPAAFLPAVGLAFILMALAGLMALCGYLRLAVVNLALCSIAVAISPVTEFSLFVHSLPLTVLYATPFIVGFGGLLMALSREK